MKTNKNLQKKLYNTQLILKSQFSNNDNYNNKIKVYN